MAMGLLIYQHETELASTDYEPAAGCREGEILLSSADWCLFHNYFCGVAV